MYLHQKFSATNPLDFSKIQWFDFIPAAEAAMIIANKRIKSIKETASSFDATILKLEESCTELEQVVAIFTCLVSVNKTPNLVSEIDNINEILSEMSNKVSNDILFDQELFKKVEEVSKNTEQLNSVQKKLVTFWHESFLENGVNLSVSAQNYVRELNDKISKLGIKIQSNIQDETQNWRIEISSLDQLKGLPDSFIEEAQVNAKQENKSGWLIHVNDATYDNVVSLAKNRDLRIKMTNLFRSRGMNPGEFNNQALINELLQVRQALASTLGYENPAKQILSKRMIKEPAEAFKFLEDLSQKLQAMAQSDFEIVTNFATADGVDSLTNADRVYYENFATKKLLDLDVSQVRYYLPYKKVWHGLGELVKTLFKVEFVKINAPTWHPDVEVYQVVRHNTNIGLLYVDLFTRAEKGSGAWMDNFVHGGAKQAPVILIAANLNKIEEQGVQLLNSLDDVHTIFHELGHALHALCSEVPYPSLAGTFVAWDFVELPSQIMENFIYEPEVLNLITEHYQTKENLPRDLVEKFIKSKKLFKSWTTQSYVGMAQMDLLLHMLADNEDINFDNWEKFLDAFFLVTRQPGTGRNTSFSHIWGGGYEAGYYSYIWAELLDSDCFEVFKEQGVLNPTIGEKFRADILAVGSSRDEMESFKAFRGREPNIDSYLKKF